MKNTLVSNALFSNYIVEPLRGIATHSMSHCEDVRPVQIDTLSKAYLQGFAGACLL